ncbi:hypothetical protein [Streptomyces noursei]|uniref:hypothetical protein n=1 Tax=Streptomyces noursei TaxID=1971 RepID=UPI0038081674
MQNGNSGDGISTDKDGSACFWTKDSQAPAEPLPKQCVSPVWHNGTEAPVPWTFSTCRSRGCACRGRQQLRVLRIADGRARGVVGGPAPVLCWSHGQ